MRIRHLAYVSLMALALAGCNDTLDSASYTDLSTVKNKVEQPLPTHIVADMAAKGMDRNSPIMIRILKEEGMMEIWKARRDNRFEKIADYKICAWSGRLGPKVKEGDRQAPEGFYNLTPANLNPNSKYYLAINTGFPNKYDQANGRSGANLMIHGACSSSGCYSMTDQEVLEIYAFARDAFKGGEKTVQLQAFPFRMTAENMVRHRLSPNYPFWQMLKVGYDNFEVTKRPPEVEVCEKKYVFNQQAEGGAFNATGKCPAMSTPPALQMALASYDKNYQADYAKAMSKYDGVAWYDPTEAERKAVVAKDRKGKDIAYAPTGTALAAGKLMKVSELEDLMAKQSSQQIATGATATMSGNSSIQLAKSGRLGGNAASDATVVASIPAVVPIPQENPLLAKPAPIETAENQPSQKSSFWGLWSKSSTTQPAADATPAPAPVIAVAPAATTSGPTAAATATATIPVPQPNPEVDGPAPVETAQAQPAKKPFWKFWSKE